MLQDEFRMFVPPCGKSFDENDQYRMYYCPADWSRRAAAFLGIYTQKSVRRLGRIDKIVTCDIDMGQGTLKLAKGSQANEEERQRIIGAARDARNRNYDWDITRGYKFYLCDEWVEIDFVKISPYGIQGHRYFDLREVLGLGALPGSLAKLGQLLSAETWE